MSTETWELHNMRAVSAFWAVLTLGYYSAGHTQPAPQKDAGDLSGTSWQLVKFEGSDDRKLTPGDKAQYTMTFGSDGRVSVRVDCNRGHGTWKSSGPNQLEFGPLALTRAMCPPAPLNERLPRDWQYVRSYVLEGGHLFLALMADAGIYEFEPQTPSTSSAATGSQPTTIAGLPATFVGTLPCADCPGIRYQLNLFPEHTFVSRMTYEERKSSFDERGRWRLSDDGATLMLLGGRKGTTRFSLRGTDTLRPLDASGHEIESTHNYHLTRAPTFSSIEPHTQGIATASLENTYWKLIHLGGVPVTAASAAQEPYFVLNSETHRVSGSGGCNRLTGRYELSGDQLRFSQMAGTLMACVQGMETEGAFLQALESVHNWKIAGEQLELFESAGKLAARFEAR